MGRMGTGNKRSRRKTIRNDNIVNTKNKNDGEDETTKKKRKEILKFRNRRIILMDSHYDYFLQQF